MSEKPLRTIDVASRTGISVNTVHLYEKLGYLPSVPRAKNGYRMFRELHIQHVQMTRCAMQCTWIGGTIRKTAQQVLLTAAQGQYTTAQETAEQLIRLLEHEKTHAENAVQIVEHWTHQTERQGKGTKQKSLRIGEVAQQLHVTIDELRSWERNQLISVPRAPNGYRLYGTREIERLVVIRTLRRARYSIMTIFQLMQHVDEGNVGNLRALLDSPVPDPEMEQYPTDSWLSTLEIMCAAAEKLQNILNKLANPP